MFYQKKYGQVFRILILLAFVHSNANCQRIEGLYLSEKDFLDQKLSYNSSDESPCRIKTRSSFPFKEIKIKCTEHTILLSKDSVYGYRDKTNTIFRFYERTAYTLINPGEEIPLYKTEVSNPTKFNPAAIHYFFSRNAGTAIHPLTINTVLEVFKDNKQFSNLVELRFRNNAELTEYDTYHKKYRLNCLLDISKNLK